MEPSGGCDPIVVKVCGMFCGIIQTTEIIKNWQVDARCVYFSLIKYTVAITDPTYYI